MDAPEKKYIPSNLSYDATIWMADVKGGDISARKGIFYLIFD